MTFAKTPNPAAPPADASAAPAGAAATPVVSEDPAKGRTIIAGAAHAPSTPIAAGPMAFKSNAESSDVVPAPGTVAAVETVSPNAIAAAAPNAVAQGSAAPIVQQESGGAGAKVAIAGIVLVIAAVVAYLTMT